MQTTKTWSVGGQKANTLRKYLRLKRREAGVEGGYDCHPTKKRTAGRLRHFTSNPKLTRCGIAYENLLFSLGCRTGAF